MFYLTTIWLSNNSGSVVETNIATLTAKLNAYEETLNWRAATTEIMAYKAQQVIALTTNNNGDDKKKKKKNSDWKKKVKCFGCGKNGHIARDCSHKKDGGQDGGRKKEEAFCSYVNVSVTADSWIVNSAASCHMTLRREWFVTYEPYVVQVNIANGNQIPSADRDTILIRALVDGEWSEHSLVNVLQVPSFDRNLFSTPKIVERGCKGIDDAKSIKFEKNGRIVLAAVK